MPAVGKKLELLIREAARELENRQLARIWKWPEDIGVKDTAQRCGSCGQWNHTKEVLYRSRTGCDFFGYTASGRVILLEAKEAGGTSLEFGEKGLKPHQIIALRDGSRAGGLAFVFWMRNDEVATLDIDMVDRLSKDRKSLPWKAIPEKFRRTPIDGQLSMLFEPWIS